MTLDVASVTVEGTWLRHMPAGVDPAQCPDPPGDNRWQRGHVVDPLYLADSPACTWAQWYRHLAEAAMSPNIALPRDEWRYEIAPLPVATCPTPPPSPALAYHRHDRADAAGRPSKPEASDYETRAGLAYSRPVQHDQPATSSPSFYPTPRHHRDWSPPAAHALPSHPRRRPECGPDN